MQRFSNRTVLFPSFVVLLVTFLLAIVGSRVYSKETYFDFEFPTNLIFTNFEYQVNFYYTLIGVDETRFTVKPMMENGTVEIFDQDKDSWAGQNILRSQFPKLKPELKLKITSFGALRSSICFELQEIKTTVIYKTPCKTVWNRNALERYVDLINVKILQWAN